MEDAAKSPASNITPIPKCTSPSLPSDFRPISLLPILGKVLEKFVAIKWILPRISVAASSSQFAYIPSIGGGTTTALILIQHKILEFLDSSSGAVRVLSIDFAKAFDKIPHPGILETAYKFHLPKKAISWVRSFLSERFQRVKIRDKFSNWHSGVPQGSVIGPLLFCMFVDDLNSIMHNSLTFKYADDVTILHFLRNSEDDKLQLEYENVQDWSLSHCLPINASKCRVLDISTKKSITFAPIQLPDGSSLMQVSSLCLLGITLSSDMKWSLHVEQILRKACKRIFLLRNLRRSGCPHFVMLHTYNSIIRSTLIYAYPAFCNLPQHLQEKFLKFERRAFRIIGESSVPNVIQFAEETCKHLFTKVSQMEGHPLRQCFSQRSTVTRASMQLRPPRAKTKRFSSSFVRFAR